MNLGFITSDDVIQEVTSFAVVPFQKTVADVLAVAFASVRCLGNQLAETSEPKNVKH
jgi:hypothetical protein